MKKLPKVANTIVEYNFKFLMFNHINKLWRANYGHTHILT